MKASLAKQHLHGKLIEPEQVASVVTFLFTDGASAINGSTIPVEDGFYDVVGMMSQLGLK